MENENDLKKIMRSHSEMVSKMKLPIVLGIDSKNKPKIVDLAKVGNILVGGASGQGKTNLLHAFAQSIYYAPRKVFEGCFVIYIDPKGMDCSRPYFDPYLTTMEEICEALEMLCDNIKILMSNPNLSFPPKMVLIDDFDFLVMYKKEFMDMLVYIAERGHLVGVHLVAASIPVSWKVFSGRLKANMPTRICFRITDKSQSRLVLDTPDATLLSQQGEMFFSYNLKLTRLQTINVIDNNGE